MKRLSQIYILKKLVLESINQPEIIFEGDLSVSPGLRICLYDKDKNMIGSTNVLDYDSSIGLDPDINRFNNKKTEYCREMCDDNFFNGKNSVYLHSLFVDENHRNRGYADILKNECHEIAKSRGFDYATSIVSLKNEASQELNKKHGYKVHQTNGFKDFFYKKL